VRTNLQIDHQFRDRLAGLQAMAGYTCTIIGSEKKFSPSFLQILSGLFHLSKDGFICLLGVVG
jgi:hypothetical protein